jgi:hypothetical protein
MFGRLCRIQAELFVAEVSGRPRGAAAWCTGDEMRFLLSVIHDQPGLATEEEMDAINVFNDRLGEQGQWVFAGGLASPDSATVIDNRRGDPVFSDGPFLESKEFLAGFWVIEAPDLDVAMKLAAEGSKACNRKIEVRPFL